MSTASWAIAAAAMLGCSMVVFVDATNKGRNQTHIKRRKLIVGVGVVLIGFLLVHGLLESKEIEAWIQTLTGNWSPDIKDRVPKLEFSILTSLAIVINLSALAFLYDITRKIVSVQRRAAVRLADVFRLRDRSIKNRIINSFPEEQRESIREIVNEAFKSGSDFWENRHLVALLGSPGIQELNDQLEKQVSAQPAVPATTAHMA